MVLLEAAGLILPYALFYGNKGAFTGLIISLWGDWWLELYA
jgi:hypothetical protein